MTTTKSLHLCNDFEPNSCQFLAQAFLFSRKNVAARQGPRQGCRKITSPSNFSAGSWWTLQCWRGGRCPSPSRSSSSARPARWPMWPSTRPATPTTTQLSRCVCLCIRPELAGSYRISKSVQCGVMTVFTVILHHVTQTPKFYSFQLRYAVVNPLVPDSPDSQTGLITKQAIRSQH